MFGKRSGGDALSPRSPVTRPAAPPPPASGDRAPPPAAAAPKPAAPRPAAPKGPPQPKPVTPVAVESRSEGYYQIKTTIFNALIDTIDLAQLAQLDAESAREEIRDIVNEIISIKNVVMSIAEQETLLQDICNDVLGYGPLEPLLARDDIADIMVNGAERVFIEVSGKVQLTNIRFRDNGQLMNICQRIVSQVGRRVDESSPICDARLPDGSRVNVIVPPLSLRGTAISIRKFSAKPITLDNLRDWNAMSNKMCTALKIAGACRFNIVISGGTGSGTLTFNPATGALATGGTGTINVAASSAGAQAFSFDIDFTSLTQLETDNSAYAAFQDGVAAGTVTGYAIETKTGQVYAQYSNGLQNLVAQLAVTSFVNPAGLVKVGQHLYQQGVNAGEPNTGLPDSNGRGAVIPGSVEASNVDLSQEFTNMILAQRGFQASSRVITTSDEMLQELVNLKR